jgi:CO/xanthine dehydrogenase FAD-binding subunit
MVGLDDEHAPGSIAGAAAAFRAHGHRDLVSGATRLATAVQCGVREQAHDLVVLERVADLQLEVAARFSEGRHGVGRDLQA